MQFAHLCSRNLFAVILSILAVPAAHAAYTMTIAQVAANVVATGSGSIDVTDLSLVNSTASVGAVVVPQGADIVVGSMSNVDTYFGLTGPISFGSGGPTLASTKSGATDGVEGNAASLYVPHGYVSGTDLGTSTDTFTSQNFSSLGLTPGTYTWTWGTGPDADSFTVNVVVPEPTSLSLLALTSIALLRRRQRASLLAKNN